MASYLVTGGAGFIGSHLVEELLRRGARVGVADNSRTVKKDNRQAAVEAAGPAATASFELMAGDLADAALAAAAVQGMDFVLHQAAIPSVPRSVEDPVMSHRANVDTSLNVLV